MPRTRRKRLFMLKEFKDLFEDLPEPVEKLVRFVDGPLDGRMSSATVRKVLDTGLIATFNGAIYRYGGEFDGDLIFQFEGFEPKPVLVFAPKVALKDKVKALVRKWLFS